MDVVGCVGLCVCVYVFFVLSDLFVCCVFLHVLMAIARNQNKTKQNKGLTKQNKTKNKKTKRINKLKTHTKQKMREVRRDGHADEGAGVALAGARRAAGAPGGQETK